MCDWIPRKLRLHLNNINSGLAAAADELWRKARDVHDRQNRSGNPNENGRLHVRMVEHNIWRLLDESHDSKGQKNLSNLKPEEVFLLSAAACSHDFDKALGPLPSGFEHGEGSGAFVVKNHERLGLQKAEAEAISSVVSLHNVQKEQFGLQLQSVPNPYAGPLGPVNLRRLVILLKAADILHADASRISSMIGDGSDLAGIEKKKHLFRSCITGWRVDGSSIIVQAAPNGAEQQKALNKCFDYMKNVEWATIANHLVSHELPSELVLADGPTGTKIHPKKETIPEQPELQEIEVVLTPVAPRNDAYEKKTDIARKIISDFAEISGHKRGNSNPRNDIAHCPEPAKGLCGLPGNSLGLVEKLKEWDCLASRALNIVAALVLMEASGRKVKLHKAGEITAEERGKIRDLVDVAIDHFLVEIKAPTEISDNWLKEVTQAAAGVLETSDLNGCHANLQKLLRHISYLKRWASSHAFANYDGQFMDHMVGLLVNASVVRDAVMKYVMQGLEHQRRGIAEALKTIGDDSSRPGPAESKLSSQNSTIQDLAIERERGKGPPIKEVPHNKQSNRDVHIEKDVSD
jgi:hypothetical protein